MFVCTVWRDVRWFVCCFMVNLCVCVLLLLFNVLVSCGCELLCDVVRVVVLFLLVLVYVCGSSV